MRAAQQHESISKVVLIVKEEANVTEVIGIDNAVAEREFVRRAAAFAALPLFVDVS